MSYSSLKNRSIQSVAIFLIFVVAFPFGCQGEQTSGEFQNKNDRVFADLAFESMITDSKMITLSCLEYFSLYKVRNEDGSSWDAIQSEKYFDDSDNDGWGDCRSIGSVHEARSMNLSTCELYEVLLGGIELQFYPVGSRDLGWCILSPNSGWFIIPYEGGFGSPATSQREANDGGSSGGASEYEPVFGDENGTWYEYWCDGDCTDMDGDGLTWNDIDGDGDGLYESP